MGTDLSYVIAVFIGIFIGVSSVVFVAFHRLFPIKATSSEENK